MSAGLALLLAASLGAGLPARSLPASVSIPQVSEVRPGPAIDRALSQRQTGVFTMFSARLAHDGEIEARAVIIDGQLVEALAQRRGQPLRRMATTLPLQANPQVAARLLQMRADQPISDPEQRRAFLMLLGWRGAALERVGAVQAPRLLAAGEPIRGLIFFNAGGRAALARWAFEYLPGQSFTFSNGPGRVAWSLRG